MKPETDIYADLHRRLVSGKLPHGHKLRGEILREDYDCSASTIREALFRLSTVGLVDFQEQRGFRVTGRSHQLQHELTHLRILLESEGASLSIRNGGLSWEAQLSAAHHKLSHIEKRIYASSNSGEHLALWIQAEQDFHETLISACGSETLKLTHLVIYARFRQQLVITDKNFSFVSENITQHQSIVDAALEGNEKLVRQRIHDHLSRNLVHPLPPKPSADSISSAM